MKPLAIDLFCGLGGWTEGLLAEDYRVQGFDIEAHEYGDERYPAELILEDVLAIHGSRFAGAALIVASPPCQAYSYMAMPWARAKARAAAIRADETGAELALLNRLFDACFRIQREASEAAGYRVPLVVENVRGAIPWVGRSRWNFGSFHLWGDVPALMPFTYRARKVPGFRFDGEQGDPSPSFQSASVEGVKAPGLGHGWKHPDDPRHTPGLDFTRLAGAEGQKGAGGSWFGVDPRGNVVEAANPARGAAIGEGQKVVPAHGGKLVHRRDGAAHTRRLTNPDEHAGVKQSGLAGTRDNGKGDRWFQDGAARSGSKSSARKAASARIAKIPLTLSRYIAAHYHPRRGA